MLIFLKNMLVDIFLLSMIMIFISIRFTKNLKTFLSILTPQSHSRLSNAIKNFDAFYTTTSIKIKLQFNQEFPILNNLLVQYHQKYKHVNKRTEIDSHSFEAKLSLFDLRNESLAALVFEG